MDSDKPSGLIKPVLMRRFTVIPFELGMKLGIGVTLRPTDDLTGMNHAIRSVSQRQ
jgi:hypothetical protein